MFKEICDELIEVFKPMTDIYPFSSNRMKSIMEVTVPVYGLSSDVERYKRFYMPKNSDRMYLIYDGNIIDKSLNCDTLVYNGEVKNFFILDYKSIYSLEFAESPKLSLMILLALIDHICIEVIRKKHFVVGNSTFSKVLDGAPIFMFVYIALNTYKDSDLLRNSMVEALNNGGFKISNIDPYIDIVNNVGIETLLDNSGVVVGLSYEDKTTVQKD